MNGRLLLVLLGLVGLASGCQSREPEGFAKFTPKPEPARRALSTVLESWRSGQAPGMMETVTPKLLLVDARRQAGQRLTSFEILGEVPADNARAFAARLTFEGEGEDEGPDETPTARYLIVGIDPLYIYRQEDLDMFCHWMHDMEEPKGGGDATKKASP